MAADLPFADLVRAFIDDRYALDPVSATVAGIHEHDHRLGDFTADGFAARDAFSDGWLARFDALDESALEPAQQVDRALIQSDLRGERALQEFAQWRRQPSLYSDVITRGAYYLLMRDHASLEARLAALAERLRAAPDVLAAAKTNLDPARVPPAWIELARRTVPAGIAYLRVTVPALVPQDTALGRSVAKTLLPAAAQAAVALERYLAWLERFAKKAAGSFAIGRDAFETLIRDRDLLHHDVASLRAFGDELLRETEAKLAVAAKALGDDDWRATVARLAEDHPGEGDLVETYRREMERSRTAVTTAALATIPYGEDLVVEAMPDFATPTLPYAAYVGPAPFESRRLGRFWVHVPEHSEPDATRRERLAGHPRAGIPVIACHEGYPGHHLQLAIAADSISVARKALRSNVLIEGWGLYVEELMTDLGYLDLPETRLLRLKDLLWRAARVIVDVGLATGEMTFDEAVAFMVDRAKLEPPNALGEVRRYTLTPLQPSSYALGRAAILELRAKARIAGWGMRVFHDRLLACGSLPPRLAAKELGL